MALSLVDLLFPPRCVGCQQARGAWLCATCRETILSRQQPIPCPHGVAATLCARCLGMSDLDGVRVAGVYAPPLKPAVWALKFTGKRQSAPALAALLAQVWRQAPVISADVMVPVPMARERERQRGYNQAALLARFCARELRLAYEEHALHCTRTARSQHGLSAPERRANVANLFAVDAHHSAHLPGKRIILVDDVLTTGATLSAAATALRAAGAAEVWGLVLARPLPHDR